jgi:hypothetical protein
LTFLLVLEAIGSIPHSDQQNSEAADVKATERDDDDEHDFPAQILSVDKSSGLLPPPANTSQVDIS